MLETRACQQVGPPIFTHPLRSMEGGHLSPHPQPPPHPARGQCGGTATHIAARGEGAHHARGDEQQRRAVQHRHLTHRHRQMETRTSTSAQASHRQQRHTLRFLRRRTRLRILAQTKQRRSRSRNPLQQGRNRHTRQHDRHMPMVQPTQRQRTQPNRSTTQNNRTRNKHRMVTACITGEPRVHTHTSSSAGDC